MDTRHFLVRGCHPLPTRTGASGQCWRVKMESYSNHYLDHASTSWPKAPGVAESMANALRSSGSPVRGTHTLSTKANEIIQRTRVQVADLVGASGPEHVLFTPGATYALNLAIKGLRLGVRDHVVATCFDHNAVLRPLDQIRRESGVGVTVVRSPTADGRLVDTVRASLRPQTRLLTINHASNSLGTLLPVAELIELAHAQKIIVLLDACQTIGHIPFTLRTLPADLIAFGGHKALLGPPGIGCLVVGKPGLGLAPDITGGTGHDSRERNPKATYPSSFEPGTLNTPAISGLSAALDFHQRSGQKALRSELDSIRARCLNALMRLPRVQIYSRLERSVPIIAFNIAGISPDRVSVYLEKDHNIQTRAGLHCAPLVYDVLQTSHLGSVRASFGYGNNDDDGSRLLEAVRQICMRE